ncbi:MAG TPA: hypothetical protein PLQ45_00640 [Anaerohalosphaeraceae bacterium]|jgi:hypothetical protein|nr:hypothetical protein [Anaerohalosphaeraceae bacterium]
MEDRQNSHDMIDVTDCLEARDALRGMKNFCFWILLLSLLILEGLFWLERADWIADRPVGSDSRIGRNARAAVAQIKSESLPRVPPGQTVTSPTDDSKAESLSGQRVPVGAVEQAAQEVTEEARAAQAAEEAKEPIDWNRFKLPVRAGWALIGGLNFLVLFFAVLYVLILLITLKVSLVSRLGGISHITRAFFISLFFLLFLFPWQCIIPRVMIGAVYLPSELLCVFPSKAEDSGFWRVLMYLRFVGLWALSVWLLLWSALRSGRWYRATQRRLGIMT